VEDTQQEVLDIQLEEQHTLEVPVTQDTLEELDIQVDTPQEEQVGTLQEVLTLLEPMDTHLEAMDTHREDTTLREGQQGTQMEVDTTEDTTEKNKTPLMVLEDCSMMAIQQHFSWINTMEQSLKITSLLRASEYDFTSHILKNPVLNLFILV